MILGRVTPKNQILNEERNPKEKNIKTGRDSSFQVYSRLMVYSSTDKNRGIPMKYPYGKLHYLFSFYSADIIIRHRSFCLSDDVLNHQFNSFSPALLQPPFP